MTSKYPLTEGKMRGQKKGEKRPAEAPIPSSPPPPVWAAVHESDSFDYSELKATDNVVCKRELMDIRDIADQHHAWLVEMGWTKATPLESLALIASEVGEAVNECRGTTPTDKLGSELADIILRVVGMAKCNDIDIGEEIEKKMTANVARGNFKKRAI